LYVNSADLKKTRWAPVVHVLNEWADLTSVLG
jgi:hypothetical protein